MIAPVLGFMKRLGRPAAAALRQRAALRRWAHHADPRRCDWDWAACPYNRIALVNLLLARFPDPRYLEIGCAGDELFAAVPARRKVGVDPRAGGTIRATSDAFFETNRDRFDLIFIDGLHTYAQVRRDVANAIGCLSEGGWIALHDMLPRDWIEQHVPMIATDRPWTGNVWKVALELMATAGIDFRILTIDHGVGVLKLLRRDIVLSDLTSTLADKEFSYFYDNLQRLPLLGWEDAQGWLNGG
jgi:hypothetical protein